MRRHVLGNGTVSARVSPELLALLDALQLQGADQERLTRLTEEQWRKLLDFADLAHLTLPLALRRTASLPPWVNQRLERNLSDNHRRFEAVYAAYCEVADALERAGIPHVVLKGFTQSPEFVAEPYLRAQSDIDLYCPPEQGEAACEVLQTLGYRPALGTDYQFADHSPTMVRPGSWSWQGNMYDPAMPPSVEIHFCLWNERVSLMAVPEVEVFFGRRYRRQRGGYAWTEFQAEDKVAFLALHILRGVFSADWIIHHVFELATFLDASAEDLEFWTKWEQGHSPSLRGLEAIAFCLAQSWFSCRVAAKTAAAIAAMSPRESAWLKQAGGSPLECMFRRNCNGRLLQLARMSKPRSRRALLRRIAFPTVARPSSKPISFRYRKALDAGRAWGLATYLQYLVVRSAAYVRSNVELMRCALSIWMADQGFPRDLRNLLGACFFLTWACRSIISSSISS